MLFIPIHSNQHPHPTSARICKCFAHNCKRPFHTSHTSPLAHTRTHTHTLTYTHTHSHTRIHSHTLPLAHTAHYATSTSAHSNTHVNAWYHTNCIRLNSHAATHTLERTAPSTFCIAPGSYSTHTRCNKHSNTQHQSHTLQHTL